MTSDRFLWLTRIFIFPHFDPPSLAVRDTTSYGSEPLLIRKQYPRLSQPTPNTPTPTRHTRRSNDRAALATPHSVPHLPQSHRGHTPWSGTADGTDRDG